MHVLEYLKVLPVLDNKEVDRIRSNFPKYDVSICPTCENNGTYALDGELFTCNCDVQRLLSRHFYAANIPTLYHDISFEDLFTEKAKLAEFIQSYLDNWDNNYRFGTGITFSGDLGTGKSFAATIILKELVKRGVKGFFIPFDDLLTVQRKGWGDINEDDFFRIRETQILVLDELFDADKGSSKWSLLADTLERIVRFRVNNCLPTIITTNLQPETERTAYPRVASLLASCQLRYELNGEDVRVAQVRDRKFELIMNNWRRPVR